MVTCMVSEFRHNLMLVKLSAHTNVQKMHKSDIRFSVQTRGFTKLFLYGKKINMKHFDEGVTVLHHNNFLTKSVK